MMQGNSIINLHNTTRAMDESDEILWFITHEGTIHYEEVNK